MMDSDQCDTGRFARQLGVLGERVRAIRTADERSQQDIANRTWIGRPAIAEIEAGSRNITLDVLWRLADAFLMHWADLLDDRVTDPPRGGHPSVPFDRQLAAVGMRMYQARVLQRLSQQALTDRTGIGRSAIAEIEAGTQNITLKTLARLAAGLGVHGADLLDDRQTSPPQPDHLNEDGAVPGPAGRVQRDREPGHQEAANELVGLVGTVDHDDQLRLAELSDVQLHRHLFARRLLADYFDEMWQDANATRLPERASVAAVRDFAHHLFTTARNERLRRD